MFRHFVTNSKIIVLILLVQFIPLILFPPSSFSGESQEWWLPMVLLVLALIAVVDLLINRSSVVTWAWHLIAFAQGFNLISRLLMLFPNIMTNDNGVQTFNSLYVVLTLVAMLMSVFMLWYVELPEVKVGLLKEETAK